MGAAEGRRAGVVQRPLAMAGRRCHRRSNDRGGPLTLSGAGVSGLRGGRAVPWDRQLRASLRELCLERPKL